MRKLSPLKTALFSLLAVTTAAIGGGILYLESESFGSAVKRMISERSPRKLGVVGDFSHLKIYFFPPGIGVANPRIRVSPDNVAHLPVEGTVEAKELRASFAPIQMFSGMLRISELEVRGGAVQGRLSSALFKVAQKPKRQTPRLNWHDLFQLQIDGVRFVDTYLNLTAELPGPRQEAAGAELVVKDLVLAKKRFDGRDGIGSEGTVRAVKLDLPKSLSGFPFREANQLQWNLRFTDQGIELAPFSLEVSGVHLTARGNLSGNLLDEGSDPELKATVEAESDLGTLFLANSGDDRFGGTAIAHAQISARIKDFESTFKSEFKMEGKDLSFERISVAGLSATGGVDLVSKRIRLERLSLLDRGEGGSVEVRSTEIPLLFNQSFEARIGLENASIQWLGGAVAKAVRPLEGRITGNARVQFLPEGKSWRLKVSPDFAVSDFALTNQKLGEARKLRTIVRAAQPIHLQGGLEITPKGLEFKDLNLRLKKSQFKVAGGVRGDSGFDFTAKGPIDLSEVSEIAGSPIRGSGNLDFHIHGPDDNLLLDFDTQLTDAAYLDLRFGNLTGRITYDDGISELRFTGLKANRKNTFYSVEEGFIDLSGEDDIHIPVEIHSGRVEDLDEVLASLVSKISWYPKALRGEVHGMVDVGGKVDLPRMVIQADLEGTDWAWLGERARRVKMNAGYDRGVYFARNVVIQKSAGSVRGGLDFNSADQAMKWDFHTENLTLADFDFFERLEIPAKSKIEIKSKGTGKLGAIESETLARGFDSEVKGERYQPSTVSLVLSDDQIRAEADLFGGELRGELRYSLIPKQPSSFRMELEDFDFSPFLLILNPKLLNDPELLARFSGHIQLDFLSGQSELARGDFQVTRYELRKSGFSLELSEPIRVPIQLGYFQLKPAHFKFKNSELILSGEGRKGDVDLSLEGAADLALVEVLTPAVSKASGTANTDIGIHGPFKNLKMDGSVEVEGGKVQLRFVQSSLEELDARILLGPDGVRLDSLDAYLGDEVFSMSGMIATHTDRFPELDLRGVFDNNKVKMDPFDLIQPRGVLTIQGTEPPYRIGGALEVSQAVYSRGFGQSEGSTGKGERFLPRDQEKQAGGALFDLDLQVNANQGFFVRNEIIDAEFKGKARVIGTPESPKLLGEGRLVQGKVLFKDRPFVFESVKVDFDDPYQINPRFSASALSEVNQYKIRVSVFGRSSQWKAEFSSTPFLRENEIFSVLSSGGASTESNRFSSRDRSLVSQGEAASLILHSMDFSKDVQSKTGFQFDVQEAVDTQMANSIFRPQNLSENMAAPKVVLKRSVGRNVSLSFGSTVGVGSRNQKEVNAEYKLTPGVSMLGVWNNIEGVNTRESRTSFGLDLKFNRRFK